MVQYVDGLLPPPKYYAPIPPSMCCILISPPLQYVLVPPPIYYTHLTHFLKSA